MAVSTKYEKVLGSECSSDSGASFTRSQPKSSFCGARIACANISLCALAIVGLAAIIIELFGLSIPSQPSSSVTSAESMIISCSCGYSVAEALSRDCKWDFLASAWLPPYCRDDELSAEFDRSGPGPNGEWEYYENEEGTHLLSATEIGAGADVPGFLYYTTQEWHIVHCYFYWIKMWRGVNIEKRYNTEHHIRHCGQEFVARDVGLNDITTLQGASLMNGEEPTAQELTVGVQRLSILPQSKVVT